MTENLKKFVEKITNNEKMKNELENLGITEENYEEKIIEYAKKNGINLSKDDFKEQKVELSKDEMAIVTGGESCVCVAAGVGGYTRGPINCGCAIGGKGKYNFDEKKGKQCCFCIIGGGGSD